MDLARIAADIPVPVEAGARVRTYISSRVVGPDHGPYAPCQHRDRWFVAFGTDGGRRDVAAGPEFDRAAEARRLCRMVNGEDGLQRAETVTASTTTPTDTTEGPIAAPAPLDQAPARRCEVCDAPLPPDARPQRRTCSDACRMALSRRD